MQAHTPVSHDFANGRGLTAHSTAALQVIRRNGAVVDFHPEKISIALTKAFLAVEGSQSATSSRVREIVAQLTKTVGHAAR